MILNRKKCFLTTLFILLLVVCTSMVSATENNDTSNVLEDNSINYEDTQDTQTSESITNSNNEDSLNSHNQKSTETNITADSKENILKSEKQSTKTANYPSNINFTLTTSVINKTVNIIYDTGNETVITKNITTVNGIPDVTKLGTDYCYVDENATYTITSAEILRVMRLDSYCQQVYGFTPKYTFFRAEGSNIKYIISREKWNVIARALNSYHVKQGYYSVNPPYSVTVNLSGKIRYYPVYYDAQEWINGHQYTCGPTAMSMISQALNCYSSERKLAGIYGTTSSAGTSESAIISNSPSVHMKLRDITDNKASVTKALREGKIVFWHIRGHYMCIIAYNSQEDKFLCLNPSGPSHNINAVQWATWTQVMNTDRSLKDKGFMSVVPYWSLSATDYSHIKYYYYNMGGKYAAPSNKEYPNNGDDNKVITTVNTPSNIPTKTNTTTLNINTYITSNNKTVNNGNVLIFINKNLIANSSISNGMVSMNYTLPAYTSSNISIIAIYINSEANVNNRVTNNFTKYSAGKTYTNTSFFSNKKRVNITISPIQSKIGEEILLKAILTDSNGNLITGGNIVFKINGVSLKSDNTFNSNATVLKLHVSNGTASTTIVADKLLRDAKNITVSYSGTSTYIETRATQTAAIALRYAQLTVTATPSIQKHYETITFKAIVEDVTGNTTFRPDDNDNSYVYFKVNGVTIKENGTPVLVSVNNGVAEYNYTVPRGMAGITNNYTYRNYTVLAGYVNPDYYPTARNTTVFNVERSNVSVNIASVTYNTSDNHLIVDANITDYKDNCLIGNNKFNIKVNGVTIMDSNDAVLFFNATDGIISVDVALDDSIKKVRSVEIVTGERSAYLTGRTVTSDILDV